MSECVSQDSRLVSMPMQVASSPGLPPLAPNITQEKIILHVGLARVERKATCKCTHQQAEP
jgi:hypothetical protein